MSRIRDLPAKVDPRPSRPSRRVIQSAACTDPGRKRESNQDYFLLDPEHDLYLLADGMGGHAAGDTAARVAAVAVDDFIHEAIESSQMTWPFGFNPNASFESNALSTSIRIADRQVRRAAQEDESLEGMGTTLVAAWIVEQRLLFSHLGDSRLYLIRSGEMRQLTEDHSVVQEQVRLGRIRRMDAWEHPNRNVVTKALGVGPAADPALAEEALQSNDLLLLCSDGLSDLLRDSEILDLAGASSELEGACRSLVDSANQAGGDDNITVVLVHYQPNGDR